MDHISDHSSASADQVTEGASKLPSLALFDQAVESKLRSLHDLYVMNGNWAGRLLVDEISQLAPSDNALVLSTAKLMEVFESEHAKSALKHANYYSGISTAASNFAGGLPFNTSTQRTERLKPLMAKGGGLASIDQGMTEFLSERRAATDKLKPEEPFLTDDQIERQKQFAQDRVDKMSVCARTALALLSEEPSSAHVSRKAPVDNTSEELRLRFLKLYAVKTSRTCGTANEFFEAIHPAIDDNISQYEPALHAFQVYSDDHTTATASHAISQFASLSLVQRYPGSLQPKDGVEPSKTREGILDVSHILMGSKAEDQYETSKTRARTGSERLRNVIQATRAPDTTDPDDYKRWLRDVSRKIKPSKPSKPTESSRDVRRPVTTSSQNTGAEGASEKSNVGSEWRAGNE